MQNKKFFTLVAIALIFQSIEIVNAKTQWLPDYNGKQGTSRISNGLSYSKPNYVPSSCSEISSGLFELSSIRDGFRCDDFYYGARTCCKKEVCREDVFPVNRCDPGKVPDKSLNYCTDDLGTHYQGCICNTEIYSKSEADCLTGSFNACQDNYGKHYKPENCVTNTCDIKVEVNCGDFDCVGSCTDSSGNIKCYACGECQEGYEPDPYTPKKCTPSACPGGTATDASLCGDALTNAEWTLGNTTDVRSGEKLCSECVAKCWLGYADIDECLNGKQPASFCKEMGYTASSCGSGEKKLKCPFDETKVVCYSLK